ncbi:hypothetical protein ES705_29819 [subsurface metagenome]
MNLIGDFMNILKGKLNKREMFRYFGGAETLSKIDKSLTRLADQGYLRYSKIKGGKYQFILYPEPIKEIELNNETG